jgi:hypothetical protein
MPLTRGKVVGYDLARMMFQFTMRTSDRRTVACEISSIAMDSIAGARGTLPTERVAQFLRLRDRIERIASDKFDRDNLQPVRIFAKKVGFGGRSPQARRFDTTASSPSDRPEAGCDGENVSLSSPFVMLPP